MGLLLEPGLDQLPHDSRAIPQSDVVSVPSPYAVPEGEDELADYVAALIEMTERDGTIELLFAHSILGEGARSTPNRGGR